MTLCKEKPIELTKNLLELVNELSKVVRYTVIT
jgi:hypothetical protein